MRKAPKRLDNIESAVLEKADSGSTLQDFLARRFGLSRRTAKAVIDGRNVWVNRRCVWIAHHVLKTGDCIDVPKAVVASAARQCGAAARAPGAAQEKPRKIRILAETPDFAVCDKPAGLLSNADAKSVESILRVQLGEPNLQAVHRLDRDTTGCLLFAKSYAAFRAAVEVFKTHRVKKEYRAVVAGAFKYVHQTIEAPLDGSRAVTRVSREATGDGASFLRVRIETGRTNQIRRHLASVRFPILGDRTFGLKTARDARLMDVPRQMLHASQLELPDPCRKGGTIKAHSPLPADFRSVLSRFGMGRGRDAHG